MPRQVAIGNPDRRRVAASSAEGIMKVGKDIESRRADWSFSGTVPKSFVEHVRQSVPFYDAGHDLVCDLSDYFCHNDSVCYEIGVSTGQLIRKLAEHQIHKTGIQWIGIDPVEAMIEQAREHCAGIANIELGVADALTTEFAKSDMIVSYYCIQFISPRHRQELINRIYERL